jgi:hypothetical protein
MLKGVGFYENDEGNLFMADHDVDQDLIKQCMEFAEGKM